MLTVGFLIGVRHAFDADHLAAVATLLVGSSSHRQSLKVGAAWGLGHALMLLAASLLVLVYGQSRHEQLAPYFEMLVAVLLIVLGVDVIRRVMAARLHLHGHRHDEETYHYHFHAHEAHEDHDRDRHEHVHPTPPTVLRAMLVGLVHGLAGSAALLVLSVGAAPGVITAVLYICAFGLGSMLGMAAVTVSVAWPLRACAASRPRWLERLSAGTGVVSIGLGALLIGQMVWG
jgi:ABC-type nickel/cobalt efflux system permease component RcnA